MTSTPARGTIKTLRAEIDFTAPVLWFGSYRKADETAIRFESVSSKQDGFYGKLADGKVRWIGGVATKHFMAQAPVAVAPAAPESDDLDAMTFPQLMVIAKSIKLKGRGVARKPELIAGIRAHRAA